MLYLLLLSTDAITSGNITTKPAQYTFTGVARLRAYYGHSVTVTLGDQSYKISGFSMKIISGGGSSTSGWVQSSAKVLTGTASSKSTVTFSISDGYITYSKTEGTTSPGSGSEINFYCTVEFTCTVI